MAEDEKEERANESASPDRLKSAIENLLRKKLGGAKIPDGAKLVHEQLTPISLNDPVGAAKAVVGDISTCYATQIGIIQARAFLGAIICVAFEHMLRSFVYAPDKEQLADLLRGTMSTVQQSASESRFLEEMKKALAETFPGVASGRSEDPDDVDGFRRAMYVEVLGRAAEKFDTEECSIMLTKLAIELMIRAGGYMKLETPQKEAAWATLTAGELMQQLKKHNHWDAFFKALDTVRGLVDKKGGKKK